MAKELECIIKVIDLKIQSRYNVQLQTNILGNIMGAFISPAMA